jgi:hypothetical protein
MLNSANVEIVEFGSASLDNGNIARRIDIVMGHGRQDLLYTSGVVVVVGKKSRIQSTSSTVLALALALVILDDPPPPGG